MRSILNSILIHSYLFIILYCCLSQNAQYLFLICTYSSKLLLFNQMSLFIQTLTVNTAENTVQIEMIEKGFQFFTIRTKYSWILMLTNQQKKLRESMTWNSYAYPCYFCLFDYASKLVLSLELAFSRKALQTMLHLKNTIKNKNKTKK